MIESLLDQDLYSFTVGHAVFTKYSDVNVTYKFTDRNKTKFTFKFFNLLSQRIEEMQSLAFTEQEMNYLRNNCHYLWNDYYFEFLSKFQFNPRQVLAWLDDHQRLNITIKGKWYETIYWEVPLLALISECYYETMDTGWSAYDDEQKEKLETKRKRLEDNDVFFADFGTRRRRSFTVQDMIVKNMSLSHCFQGTSNVRLAMKYGCSPVGTMSHQWIMGVSALESLRYANRYAMTVWEDVYPGESRLFLVDTFGSNVFFHDLWKTHAARWAGFRQDSGDPFEFATKAVECYKKLGFYPSEISKKRILFSDSLNADRAVAIKKHCDGLGIQSSFGIGTNFTNDFSTPPLNIVIKLHSVEQNEQETPVVKISDVPTKATGDADALRVAWWTFYGKPLDGAKT